MIKPPLFAIGEDSPNSPDQWIVYLGDPAMFVMARTTKTDGTLHLWPYRRRQLISPMLERSVTTAMIEHWALDIADVEVPTKWQFIYDSRLQPPNFLYLNSNEHEGWDGILRLKQPLLFWASLDEDDLQLGELQILSNPDGNYKNVKESDIESAKAEAIIFAEHYLDAM